MYNILTEPLIRFDRSDGKRTEASLPEIYAALLADTVIAFPALRPHQRHAWHAFLVQLGAMAMHRAGVDTPPESAEEWAKLIRGLTPDHPDDEPWQLVVDGITKPAFMQPPASSKDREKDYKATVDTPDELDMLVTSKNHDLKSAVAVQADVDDWIFALVALQTMEGYGGAKNYGISRMPSGYGNRSAFSLTPSERVGIHVRRDLIALLEHRQAILNEYPVYSTTDSAICLVWTQPWDGKKAEALLPSVLGPFYVEICRRIRLHRKHDGLYAVRSTSDGRRIIDMKGLTGDPWAPVSNATNPKGTPPAFLGPRKFGYERVVAGLTSPDWKQPALLKVAQYDKVYSGDMQLVARGMVRGEGGTDGYYERVIPLRLKTIQGFVRANGLKVLGDLARERIEEVRKVQRILSHAIQVFVARGDSDKITSDQRNIAQTWLNRLDEMVDARFFEDLQKEFEVDGSDERTLVRNGWLRNGKDGIVDHANRMLVDAENTLPCPSIQRYKAKVQADSVFWSRLHGSNGLPFLFQRVNEEDVEWQNNNQASPVENPTEAQMHLFE